MLLKVMRVRAASILVPGVLVLVTALSACGIPSLKSAADPVAVAAENTAAAKTVSFSMTMTEQAPSLPAPLTLTAKGAMDFATRQASMSMDMSQMASIAGSALGSPSGWNVEMVMNGAVIYMKAPFLQTLLKSAKPWMKIDIESMAKQRGLDLSSLMSYDPSEVTRYLGYLRGAKDTQVIGHELVRGVETTHYLGRVDFGDYLNALPADERAAARAALDEVSRLGSPVYGLFDVWIDAQNRVRREEFSYSMNTATTGTLQFGFSMDFYDYDAPVDITIPPADQTADLMQLASSLGNG
jgi:hypothetical protein